jgi:hypothetical protein
MGGFQKTTCNSGATRRHTVEREILAELGATDLKPAFGSWEPMESCQKS